ncbi:MAG: hypothetical protein HWN68_15240 [Desulfobacterales bacterium]|nr:hypothetical protein [Desulfobacterales bacterium]
MVKEFGMPITTIRDVIHRPLELIVNSTFEQDFVGWIALVVSIDTDYYHSCCKSCKFEAYGVLYQTFPVPIGVDWFTALYCWLRANAIGKGLRVIYHYSDGTQTSEDITVTTADTWQLKTLSPTPGKHMRGITFDNPDALGYLVWLDDIYPIF